MRIGEPISMPATARAVAIIVLVCGVAGCALSSRDATGEVQDAVRAYFEAVNRADPTAIMDCFSRNPDTTSVYDGDLVRGWEEIRRETDKLAGTAGEEKWAPGTMEITFVDQNHALVVVPVNISLRAGAGNDEMEGASTFLLEKVGGKWKILHEHHSVKPSESEDDWNSSRG